MEETMGIPIIDLDECTGCEECVEECPAEALEIVDGVAVVNAAECTECGDCTDTCPSEAIQAS